MDAQALRYALEESLKLQRHYARLLNAYDGGQRREFANADEWIERIVAVGEIPIPEPPEQWPPQPTEAEDLLIQLANAELAELPETAALELPMQILIGLIGIIHVGLRHPGVGQTQCSATLRDFLASLILTLSPDKGPLYELLMRGFDPKFDVFREFRE